MTNADVFHSQFGIYASELWAMPEKEFLDWLNSEYRIKTEIDHAEKVITGLACSEPYGTCEKEQCPYYHDNDCLHSLLADALSLLKAQNEVIQALLNVGYPHGFYLEEPWVVNYMYAITDVIKKAVNLNNERST